MPALAIVEVLNVIEELRVGDVAGLVDAFPDPLFLEAAEEGFRHRIVPATSPHI